MSNETVKGPEISNAASSLISELERFNREKLEVERAEAEEERKQLRHYSKDMKGSYHNAVVYIVIILSMLVLAYASLCIYDALWYADTDMHCSIYLLEGIAILDILMLIVSSAWPKWNFHHRKRLLICLILLLTTYCIVIITHMLVSAVIVPLLLLPEPNEWITRSKWMFLIRTSTIFPTLLAGIVFIKSSGEFIFEKEISSQIYEFRILNHIDLRRHKRFMYDTGIIRKVSNGKDYYIKESDRYMHMLVNGQTGTAKTSSILIPMINGDLNIRCRNQDRVKKLIWKGLRKGYFRMDQAVTDRSCSLAMVSAVSDTGRRLLNEYKKIYHIMGTTVICPDDSLADVVYDLCVSKNIPCNRIDPLPDPTDLSKSKKGFKGFNPLYISPKTPKSNLTNEIVNRATLFADVLQAIYDENDEQDPYFVSVNRSMTTSFTICLCATMPYIDGRQPTPADVQYMVNKFSRITRYYEKLKEINLSQHNGLLQFVLDYIDNDILHDERGKLNDQARGLRNILNELLANPLVNKTLCVPDDMTVDMDVMLEEGQITVVNYALKLGQSDSRALGLFFLLSFIQSVFRRPGAEGSNINPHALVIDELPVLLHPQIERILTLFRKYRVSFVGAIQSLAQMEKNDSTRYLEDILLGGCATHFLYGRCGEKEMQKYSRKAGKEWVITESYSMTETPITAENPTSSYTTRTSQEQRDTIEETDIYNLHFQECWLFTVRNGEPLKPFKGKTEFLPSTEKNWMKRKEYMWDKFYYQVPVPKDDQNTVTAPKAKTDDGENREETHWVSLDSCKDEYTTVYEHNDSTGSFVE